MTLYPLYIDPGTGSMLFSILIGSAATLYFVGRAFIIKMKVILSGGKSTKAKSTHQFVVYNEGKQYCNVFKPVLDEFEGLQREVIYLSSAPEDPLFHNSYKFVKTEFIGEGNRAFARLNLLNADVVLMTTPGLDVYQLKRSKTVKHYMHVLHAPSDATMYRMFGVDYFDSILLTGDYQGKDIRVLEKIRTLPEKKLVTVGCTYLDVYAEKVKTISKEENRSLTVLVSPSWGPSALLSRYGEKLLDPLVKAGAHIIVRPHPQSKKSESAMLEKLTLKYKDAGNLEWDTESDNIYSLSKADIMISDFSGIIFDYAFLFDKPVLYVKQGLDLRPYDADDVCVADELWQFKTVAKIGIELKEEMFEKIGDIIHNASDSHELKAARNRAKEEAWQYQGEAGKRIAHYMIETVDGA
jgi:hypothetical protein